MKTDNKLPKYKQFVSLFLDYIDNGQLKNGEKLPSIMDCSLTYGLSRDTIFKAYKELHKKGYITSINRRGYYVSHVSTQQPCKRIFISSGRLTGLNISFYKELWCSLEENNLQWTYINHLNDIDVLRTHLEQALGNYHFYLIEPQLLSYEKLYAFFEEKMNANEIIMLNDQENKHDKEIRQIYFDIEMGLAQALANIGPKISKYKTLNLVMQAEEYFPYKLIKGFFKHCDDNSLEGNILESIDEIHKGNAYLIVDEKALFKFLKRVQGAKMEIGNEVGILALFDKP